jgi:hypothetical protein
MAPNKELRLAYGLMVVLFVVGVITYAAFPAKTPDVPVRLMFKAVAGKVLFDHKTHTAASGYGLSCHDCHHHPADDDAAIRPCGDCHNPPEKGQQFTAACAECHEPEDIEGTEMLKRGDAFHEQCIGCHKEYGAGAVKCSECHVL